MPRNPSKFIYDLPGKRRRRFSITLAVSSIVLIAVGLALLLLCVFAGSRAGLMDSYFVLRIDGSQVGKDLRAELENRMANLADIFKREPATGTINAVSSSSMPLATVASPVPSSYVEARANVEDIASSFQGGGVDPSQLASVIDSKASSVASQATKTAGETTEEVEKKIADLAGKAFESTIEGLGIRKTYSLHLLQDCTRTERTREGRGCDTEFLNSVRRALKILFIIASSFAGLTLLSVLICVGHYRRPQLTATLQVMFFLMLFFTCLAASISESIASASGAVFDDFTKPIGIESRRGTKFFALAWTADGLLLASTLLWFVGVHLSPQ